MHDNSKLDAPPFIPQNQAIEARMSVPTPRAGKTNAVSESLSYRDVHKKGKIPF